MKKSTIFPLTLGAVIAALFAALTLVSSAFGLAIGPFELRLSEALCILPVFTPAAVPGLTVGCLLANLLCGANLLDILFGTLATFLGAVGTRMLRKHSFLAFLPPILANTAIVPPLLYYAYGFTSQSLPVLFLSIFVGEVLSAGVLGFFLKKSLLPLWKKLK